MKTKIYVIDKMSEHDYPYLMFGYIGIVLILAWFIFENIFVFESVVMDFISKIRNRDLNLEE